MPNPTVGVRVNPADLERGRVEFGLPADATPAQIIRAGFLRALGITGADGDATYRGGRPRKRTSATASTTPI